MNSIEIKNFNFNYLKNKEKIFNDVNITFPNNELSLLIGPSGCGKSTLMQIVAGINESTSYSGNITINQQNIQTILPENRTKIISMMFQDPNQQFVMQKVREELVFALENIQTPTAEIEAKVQAALTFCEIQHLANRQIISLSGGEKQKVILATMVALDSDIMLLDEPFASIDPAAKQDIIAKLIKLKNQKNKTIIISDHDLTGYQGLIKHVFRVANHTVKELTASETKQLLAQNVTSVIPVTVPNQKEKIELEKFQLASPTNLLVTCQNFKFYPGCTLITGASGIGKSTLFRALVNLQKYAGNVIIEQLNSRKIKKKLLYQKLALIFQNANDQFLNVTVSEELQLAKQTALSNFWTDAKINVALQQLHLENKQDQIVYSLSGGQKKKLQLLLMLIRDPEIMLLDEPFAGLDSKSIDVIEKLLQESFLQRKHSLLIISHQIVQFNHFFDYHIEFANQTLAYKEVL